MNGEDGQSIVETRDVVHLGAIEQVATQRCGTRIADEARRDDEADPAARSDELKGTLDEELIQVDVRPAFHAIDSGLADEVGELPGIGTPPGPDLLVTAVAADHVPRRVADNGVEASRPGRGLRPVRKDVRKGQRPVQEAMAGGDGPRAFEKGCCETIGQR